MASLDTPPRTLEDTRLADVPSLGDDAVALVSLLLREDQGHVLAAWRAGAPEQEAAKRAQLEQVRGLERGYPGGLAAYLRNARKLLAQSAAGDNPFEGMRPEVRKNE
jgi:UDP-sugar pyrophosphorylase